MTRSFEWQWNFKILLFTAVFLPLTVSLGFWQLDRAQEKRDILAVHQARNQATYIGFSEALAAGESNQDYLRVSVEDARFPPLPTLLLDNRVRHGLPGYEVLNILRTVSGRYLLVNRGWIAGSGDRRRLPEVAPPTDGVRLQGHLYRSPGKQLVLGEDDWNPRGVLEVVQDAEPAKVAERLGIDLYPYTLRLEQDSQGALDTDWVIVNVQPGMHTGYAVQWFAMAIVLVIMTLFANSNLGQLWKSYRNKDEVI